jgi:hypothetical protein
MDGPARGEVAGFALVSGDYSVKAFARAVPFPLEGTDSGCLLTVQPVDKDGKFYALHGQGFQAGENVSTEARSDGEVINDKAKAAADGMFEVLLAPRTINKTAGHGTFNAKGRSCAPSVEYDWGLGANDPQ